MRAMVQCAAVRNHLTVKTLQHNARMESLLSARLKVVVIRAARRCYSSSIPDGIASVGGHSRQGSTYNQECFRSALDTESIDYLGDVET